MCRSIRPLLPATAKVDREPPLGSAQKRKQRPLACEACRSHKTKVLLSLAKKKTLFEVLTRLQCTSERPTCGACLTRKTSCRYVETEARKTKRKYEDLQKHRSAHEDLVSLMRTLPEQDAVELFRRVRAGGDLEATLNHVRDGDLLLQMHLVPETRLRYELPYSRDIPALLIASGSPYLDSMIHEAALQRVSHSHIPHTTATGSEQRVPPEGTVSTYMSPYVKPYHAAVFAEPRLETARPSDWTNVSKDDVLMRNLLAAYFTHEYHSWPVFHKDHFLEDMASSQKEERRTSCCSSLLVNVTLAYACVSQLIKGMVNVLITLYSYAVSKFRIVSSTGNQKLLDTDLSLRQKGSGECRLSVASTADSCRSRLHYSCTLFTIPTAWTRLGVFTACKVLPSLKTPNINFSRSAKGRFLSIFRLNTTQMPS